MFFNERKIQNVSNYIVIVIIWLDEDLTIEFYRTLVFIICVDTTAVVAKMFASLY